MHQHNSALAVGVFTLRFCPLLRSTLGCSNTAASTIAGGMSGHDIASCAATPVEGMLSRPARAAGCERPKS